MTVRPTWIAFSLATLLVACAAQNDDSGATADALDVARHAPDAGVRDSGTTSSDAGTPSQDASTSDDGTPTRQACTSSFGSGLSSGSHGRLDGTLVSIVPPGSMHACNDDSGHVHLQIEMGGSVYDIAVNVHGVLTAERDAALAGGAWSEGWHSNDALDFTTTLGLHSTDFTAIDEATATQHVEDMLANVNHISVFATKYSTGGAHLVHRNGNGNDGALVLYPLSGQPHFIMFRFPTQTF